jgi:hypothetical protein
MSNADVSVSFDSAKDEVRYFSYFSPQTGEAQMVFCLGSSGRLQTTQASTLTIGFCFRKAVSGCGTRLAGSTPEAAALRPDSEIPHIGCPFA